MKNAILFTLLVFFCFCGQSQVTYNHLGNQNFEYSSGFSTPGLHFFLYGDGYHSFDQSHQHQYGTDVTSNNPANVRYFQSDPYDGSRPTKHYVHSPDQGSANANTPQYLLPNQVSLKRSWNLVRGEENYYILAFENNQCNFPIDGSIEFHFDQKTTVPIQQEIEIDNNNVWLDDINPTESNSAYQGFSNKLEWTFSNLQPNEQRFIYIPAHCDSKTMSKVSVRAEMNINDCNGVPVIPDDSAPDGNNSNVNNSHFYTLDSRVRKHPKDPNYITSDPSTFHYSDVTQTIRYKIYFQNEGEGPANDVFLDYLIQAPFYNVTLIDASHTCELNWSPIPNEFDFGKKVEIDFYGIDLPGMNQDNPTPTYESTIGWVEIDICYDLKVFSYLGLECVDSEVAIVFNSQLPEIARHEMCRDQLTLTSSANALSHLNFICSPDILPYQELGIDVRNNYVEVNDNKFNFSLAPNPATDVLNIINIDPSEIGDVIIYNNSLEIVRSISTGNNKIDISDLKSGLYYLYLQTDDKSASKKFIKI